MVKAGSKEEFDANTASALHLSSKKSKERTAAGVLLGKSTEEDEAHTQSGFSDSSDSISSDEIDDYGSEDNEDNIAQ